MDPIDSCSWWNGEIGIADWIRIPNLINEGAIFPNIRSADIG